MSLVEEMVFHLVLVKAFALFFVLGLDPFLDVLEEGRLSAFFDGPGNF